jgi:hypothetical protein
MKLVAEIAARVTLAMLVLWLLQPAAQANSGDNDSSTTTTTAAPKLPHMSPADARFYGIAPCVHDPCVNFILYTISFCDTGSPCRTVRFRAFEYTSASDCAAQVSRMTPINNIGWYKCDPQIVSQQKASPSEAIKLSRNSYDPIPPAWSIKVDLPGMLVPGATYCTENGHCTVVDRKDERQCQEMPKSASCLAARIPVQILAMAPTKVVIVRLDGKNYAVSAQDDGSTWENPNDPSVGGPILVILNGKTSRLFCNFLYINSRDKTHGPKPEGCPWTAVH